MSNYYNASEMKNAAGRMDEEIRKFETCCSHLEDIICTLCDKWDDDNNKYAIDSGNTFLSSW